MKTKTAFGPRSFAQNRDPKSLAAHAFAEIGGGEGSSVGKYVLCTHSSGCQLPGRGWSSPEFTAGLKDMSASSPAAEGGLTFFLSNLPQRYGEFLKYPLDVMSQALQTPLSPCTAPKPSGIFQAAVGNSSTNPKQNKYPPDSTGHPMPQPGSKKLSCPFPPSHPRQNCSMEQKPVSS